MIDISTPVVFRCKIEWAGGLLFFLGGSFFTILGVGMIVSSEPAGWFVAGFFGLIPCLCLVRLLPGFAFLRVSRKGVELRECFRSISFHWSQIESFDYVGTPPSDCVEMLITDSATGERERVPIPQVDHAMPLTLANLLTDWQLAVTDDERNTVSRPGV